MKGFLIWAAACIVIGFGGGLWYLNTPGVVQPKIDAKLTNGTPDPKAKLVTKSFTNGGHKFSLLFPSDGLVETGTLAKRANQQAVLARPGNTAISYVVFAGPIANTQATSRVDCGTNNAKNVEFSVNLEGKPASVCHAAGKGGRSVYVLNVRSNGTWEQVTFFDNGLADLGPHDAEIKTMLGSLKVD